MTPSIAGEDGFHPRVIAPAAREPATHLLHRAVEGARDRPQLVVSVIEAWRRQIARAIAAATCATMRTLADAGGHDPADRGSASSATPRAVRVAVKMALPLTPDVGQRQRDAHDRDRGVLHRHSGIGMSIFSVSLYRRDRPRPF